MRKYVPWLIPDNESEVKEYVSNQLEIIYNLKQLFERTGLEWHANITETKSPSLAEKSGLSLPWRLVIPTSALNASKSIRSGRIKQMKNYLKKLGSRKFQAFLAVTIPNMIIMFGFIFGDIDLEGEINKWMPAINLVIQAIVSAVYQKIEGDADKAHIGKGTANEEFTTSTEHFE